MRDAVNKAVNPEIGAAVLETVASGIQALPSGEIMTTWDAVEASWKIAEGFDGGRVADEHPLARRSRLRRQLMPSSRAVRELVASQLVGMTYRDIVNAIEEAVSRFCENPELVIVPRPTMQFSGHCEKHDGWNLSCNANRVQTEVGSRADQLEGDDKAAYQRFKKAQQLVTFVCCGEVLRADIEERAFDGRLRPMGAPFQQAAAS